MARHHSNLFNAEDLYRLPDDGLIHELVRGQIISEPLPGARHGRICSNVGFVLQSWARETGAGIVYTCDTGFVLERNPDSVRGPDVAFVAAKRQRPDDDGRYYEGAPDLAIEVLSPGNRRSAMAAKVDHYLAAGTTMVWVVDPATETVMVRTLKETQTYSVNDTMSDVLPGLCIAVRELFRMPTYASHKS